MNTTKKHQKHTHILQKNTLKTRQKHKKQRK